MKFENLFELEEAKKENIIVSGANSSGRSRLSRAIASKLYKMGFRVIAFDTSGICKTVSDLPNLAIVYTYGKELIYACARASSNTHFFVVLKKN